jgi:hypothetical protein
MNPSPNQAARDDALLRYSLVFVWLTTAIASLWELHGQSTALLYAAGMSQPTYIVSIVVAGALLDATLGIAMLVWPHRVTYWCALAVMLGMTVIATLLLPALWLHPLGPLTKNIPIAAALWILSRRPA